MPNMSKPQQKMTKTQFNRTVKSFQQSAGAKVHVEFRCGGFIVIGEEIEILRLAMVYINNDNASHRNLPYDNRWMFVLDMEDFNGEYTTT